MDGEHYGGGTPTPGPGTGAERHGPSWRSPASPPEGLSEREARRRLQRHGPNTVPEPPPDPLWRRVLVQFRSPLIYILLFALAVDVAVWMHEGTRGVPVEAVAIAVILVLNAGLGVWQERKAERALEKLKELGAPRVWVLREGRLVQVLGTEIVPGDVVRVEAGDRVPADLVARTAENLMLDESVLTGESIPVDKSTGDTVWAGTLVVRGKTYGEVTRTGVESAMGRLAAMLGEVQEEPTPLERRLRRFGHRVAAWILALCAVIATVGLAMEGLGQFGKIFLLAVALAVAAVPEGLPAVLSVTLALGVERMARRQAVVRKLSAVEALGSVTVIATDKTGTLTENRMEVREVDCTDRERTMRALMLATDAEPDTGAGDPLELALFAYARREGWDPAEARESSFRRSSRAFDSAAKYMRVTVAEAGGAASYLKGAPEVMLSRSALAEDERRRWAGKVDRYAREGYRLVALAWGEGEVETDLQWLGLVLLWDPPRPEVPDAVRRAQEAGIRVMMITGDHPATALNVARLVGIEGEGVMTGAELHALDPAAAAEAVAGTSVFARVTPEHKLRIVDVLKQHGEIVAVTGDGVNDAPALKRSDVGVAMGRRGSAVTREVADLVLLDDNFATIVSAIAEGRSIYENIQKFIRFLFSTNLCEVLVVTLAAFAAFALGLRDVDGTVFLPLTAVQLLWINLVTDGAPALALGLDRNPGVLRRRPRDPASSLLDRPSVTFILASGTIKTLIAFTILALMPRVVGGMPMDVVRSSTFLFLAAGQLLYAYPARQTGLGTPPNPILHLAIAAGFAVQLLVVSVPFLMRAFDTVPLGAPAWGWVVGGIALSWAAADLTSRLIWRRQPVPGPAVAPFGRE